jgi:tripartite-type tricarboxylate transporter receptor subunit TctC
MDCSLGIRSVMSAVVLACVLAHTGPVQAQDSPTKPIRMVVGFGRGGGTDVIARIIAPALSESLGQPIVIDNVPGAGGSTAAAMVAKSPNDGSTVFLINSGHAVSAVMYKSLPYDAVKDFEPVMLIAASSLAVLVNKDFPAHDIPGLIALAKAEPGKLSFGSVGIGSAQHFAGELLRQMAGIDMHHVPYHDTNEAIDALQSNKIQVLCELVQAVMEKLRSGEVRALAVTSPVRWSAVPDVPTLGEQGVAGYDVTSWYGLVFPAGTPKPIVDKMHAAMSDLLKREAIRKAIADAGALVQPTTTEQFRQYIGAEIARWRRVRDRAGIQPQT